jgi:MFS family permease
MTRFTIATLLGFMGLGPFQFYFSFYAEHQKLTSTELAFNLVTIYNAVSTFGRIIPNAISDKIGPLNVLAPSICVMGVVYFCTMATHSGAGIIVLTAAAGIFLGIFTGMVPVCFAALVKDKSRLGTRIGMGFAMTSFGLLIGGPGGGAVLGSVEPLNWVGVWVFAGTSASVAGIMYVVLRFARTGFKLGVKA